jgi:hypothetical protein
MARASNPTPDTAGYRVAVCSFVNATTLAFPGKSIQIRLGAMFG